MVRYNGEYCRFLSVLSSGNAFAITMKLLEGGPLTIHQLKETLDLSSDAIRRQLANLRECGYVLVLPNTRPYKYGANARIVRPMVQLLRSHIRRHQIHTKG